MSYHTSGSMRSYGGGYGTIKINLQDTGQLTRNVEYQYQVQGSQTTHTATSDVIQGQMVLVDSNYTLSVNPPPFSAGMSLTVFVPQTDVPLFSTIITLISPLETDDTQADIIETTGLFQQTEQQQQGQQQQQGENQEGNQQQGQTGQQGQTEQQSESSPPPVNPIVEIGLESPVTNPALFIYQETGEPYYGLYHRHQDGTLMIGEGVLGVDHEMIPNEIIIPNNVTLNGDAITTPTLQPQMSISQIREMFADTVYSKWFGEEFGDDAGTYTFKDMRLPVGQRQTTTQIDVKSIQSTIRNGRVVTGRQDGEQLVFYKKDSNTPESKKDYQDSKINEILTDISASVASSPNDEFDLQSRLSFVSSIDRGNDGNGSPVGVELTNQYGLDFLFDGNPQDVGVPENNPYRIKSFKYQLIYNLSNNETKKINIGELAFINKVNQPEDEWYWYGWVNVLNLSQVTTPISSTKINSEKAREVLDTNIFELLPEQRTRQDEVNSFFQQFDRLIGPKPPFSDADNDGVNEDLLSTDDNIDQASRISFEDKPDAFITRLDKHTAPGIPNADVNVGKTLESMRNRLNTYLNDVDNVVTNIPDPLPEYVNKMEGFLKIRKPNQAIIIRNPGLELEFQKNNDYLTRGFTITMWVRFVGKTGQGTLFNFGNPLSNESPYGFRLDTFTRKEQQGTRDVYKRMVRLVVFDHTQEGNYIYDSHFGTEDFPRRRTYSTPNESIRGAAYEEEPTLNSFNAHTQIPTDDLNEWFFICATFDPNINEPASFSEAEPFLYDTFKNNKQFWLNHVTQAGTLTANSTLGARCKVEVISRSDLLRARGFKVDSLEFDASSVVYDEYVDPGGETDQDDNIAL